MAHRTIPIDDDDEEEVKKQLEIQEEQYILQQQMQQQEQQTPLESSLLSIPSYTTLPHVNSKKNSSANPAKTAGSQSTQLQRVSSRVNGPNTREKFKSSDLQTSYNQILQLQMLQASQQKVSPPSLSSRAAE
jgi:hypothetical protein